jgi:hypothetical protein
VALLQTPEAEAAAAGALDALVDTVAEAVVQRGAEEHHIGDLAAGVAEEAVAAVNLGNAARMSLISNRSVLLLPFQQARDCLTVKRS